MNWRSEGFCSSSTKKSPACSRLPYSSRRRPFKLAKRSRQRRLGVAGFGPHGKPEPHAKPSPGKWRKSAQHRSKASLQGTYERPAINDRFGSEAADSRCPRQVRLASNFRRLDISERPTLCATSGPLRQVCPPILSTLLHPPITIDRAAALSRNCRLVGPVEMDTIYSLRDRGGCHARSTKRH